MKSDYYKPALEITTVIGCKNNCSYCPQKMLIEAYAKLYKNELVLSLDNFKKILNKLPKNTRIDFSGFAEPFLNKECIDMIYYACEKNFDVTLYTILVGVIDVFSIFPLTLKAFAIHLPDNENKTNIEIDQGYLNNLSLVCQHSNAKFYYYGSIHEKVKEVLDKHKIKANNSRLFSRAGNIKAYFHPIEKKNYFCSCSKNLNHNVLLLNGDVYLCASDFGLKHELGNLLQQDYNQIFKGSEFENILNNFKKSSQTTLCYNCEASLERYSKQHFKFIISKIREVLK